MSIRAKVLDDSSGVVAQDLFFHLQTGPQNLFRSFPNVLSLETSSSAGIEIDASEVRWRKLSSGRCPTHPELKDVRQLEFVKAAANATPDKGEMFGGLWDTIVYMRPKFQAAVLEGGFQYARFVAAEIDFDPPAPFANDEIKALCFDGRSIQRSYCLSPSVENHCRNCGFGPVSCPTCPTLIPYCPNCGKRVMYIEKEGETDEEWAEKIGENGDIEFNYSLDGGSGPVLDFRLWDGSDFLGGEEAIVSGRVVDLLLSLDPDAIGFQPRLCYVGNCDPSEYLHLKSRLYQKLR